MGKFSLREKEKEKEMDRKYFLLISLIENKKFDKKKNEFIFHKFFCLIF